MNTSKPRRGALTASFILCCAALALAAGAGVYLPTYLKNYMMDFDDPSKTVRHALIIAGLYLALASAVVVIVLVLRLLTLVRRGVIFSESVLRIVTVIAWLVIGTGLLFVPMAIFFPLLFAVAYVAVTVGMCILVVRGILKDAIALKEENDQTV